MRVAPAANTPFTPAIIRLKLSKVPIVPRRTTPPLGALGLTYSKFLNPAGYLMSPNSDRLCRHVGSSAMAGATSGMSGSACMAGAANATAPVWRRARRVRFKTDSWGVADRFGHRFSADYHALAIGRHAVVAPQPLWFSLSRVPEPAFAWPARTRHDVAGRPIGSSCRRALRRPSAAAPDY